MESRERCTSNSGFLRSRRKAAVRVADSVDEAAIEVRNNSPGKNADLHVSIITGAMADFEKAGLLAVRDGRVLLCRKKHTTALLILPGGVKEAGETAEECLRREVREELGDVELGPLTILGDYVSAAAIPGKTVRVELFAGELVGEPRAAAEIKELVWFGAGDDPALLAPSLREVIFPDLARRGLISDGITFGTLSV